jgi:hypothetical protein
MLDILNPWNPRELQATKRSHFLDLCPVINVSSRTPFQVNPDVKRREKTYTLLHRLHVLERNSNPPCPPQMPPGLPREILHHDAAEDDELRVDGVQDAVVGEVEAVGDLGGEPGYR